MNALKPWLCWISEEEIGSLYRRGIELHGGLVSNPISGCIERALGAAYNAEAYSTPDEEEEDDNTIRGLTFAGYLLFYLARNHCYTDGNKRIAWTSCMNVLLRLGLTLDVTEDDAYDFCISIAGGQLKGGEDVVFWVVDRLIEI
jgi:death on curing protein